MRSSAGAGASRCPAPPEGEIAEAGAIRSGAAPGAPPPVTRRPERPEDADLLFAAFRAIHGGALAALDPSLAEMLLRRQFAGQAASYRAAHPGGRFEVAEVEGCPVGRLVTDAAGGALRLVDIALLPDWRGRGIGTRLLRTLQEEAGAAGMPLQLSVLRTNEAARRLYARLGFVVQAEDGVSFALRWDP